MTEFSKSLKMPKVELLCHGKVNHTQICFEISIIANEYVDKQRTTKFPSKYGLELNILNISN
jgi:hypothetical protein